MAPPSSGSESARAGSQSAGQQLATARILMRPWRDSDRQPFAAMNADPDVMRYFPALMTAAQSDALVDRIQAQLNHHGWGLWALEVDGGFIGFTGLAPVKPPNPVAGGVEVGWRLTRSAWGRGYATEAGRAALSFGFDALRLDEVVSFTAVPNEASRAVMRRLGMTHNPARDFEHPALPPAHELQAHVLYAISQPAYRAAAPLAASAAPLRRAHSP